MSQALGQGKFVNLAPSKLKKYTLRQLQNTRLKVFLDWMHKHLFHVNITLPRLRLQAKTCPSVISI